LCVAGKRGGSYYTYKGNREGEEIEKETSKEKEEKDVG